MTELCNFNLKASTVSTIIRNKENLVKNIEKMNCSCKKTFKSGEWPEMVEKLCSWFLRYINCTFPETELRYSFKQKVFFFGCKKVRNFIFFAIGNIKIDLLLFFLIFKTHRIFILSLLVAVKKLK